MRFLVTGWPSRTMKKMAYLIAFFLISCVARTPFDWEVKAPHPLADSYISLGERTLFGVQQVGSGVIIRSGVAVTNKHVVEHGKNIQAFMAGEIPFFVKNTVISERIDLAVFDIPCEIREPSKIGNRIQNGEQVFIAGPSSKSPILAGIVILADIKGYHDDIELTEARTKDYNSRAISKGFVYEGDIMPGYSGSPIVNAKGELVGINQGRVREFLYGVPEEITNSTRIYGFGYHMEDVLEELYRIAPQKFKRCACLHEATTIESDTTRLQQ